MAETASERDFNEFCVRQGWIAQKLDPLTGADGRTPDFFVRTASGYEFVAEVTELEPEPPPPSGESRERQSVLGNRIRSKLKKKMSQARRYAGTAPTLIVIAGGFEHVGALDPLAFDAALYGELTVTAHVPADPRGGVRFDDDAYNAGRRFFGKDHNTRVSAVASLSFTPQVLRIYHNKFAAIPLEPAKLIIGSERVEHYVKPEDGTTGWTRLFS